MKEQAAVDAAEFCTLCGHFFNCFAERNSLQPGENSLLLALLWQYVNWMSPGIAGAAPTFLLTICMS